MRIAIGNDHVGYELKELIINVLKERNIEIVDCGTYSSERVDYPIFGEKVALMVAKGEVDKGIVMCGTGIGISISANKVNGIRAAVCSEPYSAKLSKQHNDSNILAMGSRVVGKELARMILESWLDAEFEHGRHESRIKLIQQIEGKNK